MKALLWNVLAGGGERFPLIFALLERIRPDMAELPCLRKLALSVVSDGFAHTDQEVIAAEWLGEKGDVIGKQTVFGDVIVKVARHVQHATAGPLGDELFGQLFARHARHDQIGE